MQTEHFDSENEKKAKSVLIIKTDSCYYTLTHYGYQMLFTYKPPALLHPQVSSDFESKQ